MRNKALLYIFAGIGIIAVLYGIFQAGVYFASKDAAPAQVNLKADTPEKPRQKNKKVRPLEIEEEPEIEKNPYELIAEQEEAAIIHYIRFEKSDLYKGLLNRDINVTGTLYNDAQIVGINKVVLEVSYLDDDRNTLGKGQMTIHKDLEGGESSYIDDKIRLPENVVKSKVRIMEFRVISVTTSPTGNWVGGHF